MGNNDEIATTARGKFMLKHLSLLYKLLYFMIF